MGSDLYFIQTALGTIGTITGLAALLSPVPTFVQIVKVRSTERRSPWPYFFTLFSCAIWAFYGLPFVGNSRSVSVINAAGALISAVYCVIFLQYNHEKEVKKQLGFSLGGTVVLYLGGIYFCMKAMESTNRGALVGFVGDLASVMAIASPLADVRKMVKSKNVQFFPIALCSMNLLNTFIWTLFGIFTADVYVTLPNMAGVTLASTQVALYLLYRKNNPIKLPPTSAPDVDSAPLLESYMPSGGEGGEGGRGGERGGGGKFVGKIPSRNKFLNHSLSLSLPGDDMTVEILQEEGGRREVEEPFYEKDGNSITSWNKKIQRDGNEGIPPIRRLNGVSGKFT